MNHIFYILGKSASGKDTLYRMLLDALPLRPLILFTTRPMRAGEQEGREYFFVSPEQLASLRQSGLLVEERTYHTVQGDWTYATGSEQIALTQSSYLGIGTLESYLKIRSRFGEAHVLPLYVEAEDGERLLRAIERERRQEKPDYAELCRRFLADEADFSPEKLAEAGIQKRFRNGILAECFAEIRDYIMKTAQQN